MRGAPAALVGPSGLGKMERQGDLQAISTSVARARTLSYAPLRWASPLRTPVLAIGLLAAAAWMLAILVIAGLLASAPAQALLTHPFVGSFGPEGPGKGTFTEPQSIAVGPGGDVYVFDNGGEGAIYRFNANGEPADFAGRGTNVIAPVGRAAPDEEQIAVDSSWVGRGE